MSTAEYRKAHKEEITIRNAAYRKAHKEEIAAQRVTYREAHKEEITAYREAHKEENAAYQAVYRKAHKKEKAAYYKAHKEKIVTHNVMRKYGVSERDAEMLIALRDGEGAWCDICRTTTGPFDIDHDHRSRKIRGILCRPCNRRIEGIDNGFPFKTAIEYLGLSLAKSGEANP